MDPFTKRILEKAEQRNRIFGLSDRLPLAESTFLSNFTSMDKKSDTCVYEPFKNQSIETMQLNTNSSNEKDNIGNIVSSDLISGNEKVKKYQVIEKSSTNRSTIKDSTPIRKSSCSPKKVYKQFSAVDKENMDVGIEINILTDKNVAVQVEVEEHEISDIENVENAKSDQTVTSQKTSVKIRDTSRNRLQRLGALYSDTNALSSPIHRTEAQFHADDDLIAKGPTKSKHGLGKLAALARNITQWEDDTSHPDLSLYTDLPLSTPPPKPALPSRGRLTTELESNSTESILTKTPIKELSHLEEKKEKTKNLKWDDNIINSLEAQGFQRRETSEFKITYDFSKDTESKCVNADKAENSEMEKKDLGLKSNLSRNEKKSQTEHIEQQKPRRPSAAVKPGLVSGRTKMFEKPLQEITETTQKDPTELPLKERMKLFERNKEEAPLIPKAPFGMAPAISKIRSETSKRDATVKTTTKITPTTSNIPSLIVKTENKLREKVAALVNATNENRVRDDIRKQRQEEMLELTNRFNKQKNIFNKTLVEDKTHVENTIQDNSKKNTLSEVSKSTHSIPKPPPQPPVQSNLSVCNIVTKKRSSANTIDDETKRARKGINQSFKNKSDIYTDHSDFESSDNENNDCTTATMSPQNTADEMFEYHKSNVVSHGGRGGVNKVEPSITHQYQSEHGQNSIVEEDENQYTDEDSLMEPDNENKEQKVIQPNNEIPSRKSITKEVRYAEQNDYISPEDTFTSNSSSEVSLGVNDYLDEALDDDDEEDNDVYIGSQNNDDLDDDQKCLSRDSQATRDSNSFTFYKGASHNACSPNTKTEKSKHYTKINSGTSIKPISDEKIQPVKSELSVNTESNNMVTLVHTVSFYRRQQNTSGSDTTPVRRVCREEQITREAFEVKKNAINNDTLVKNIDTENILDDDTDDESEFGSNEVLIDRLVKEKLQKLLDEVCKQQQVIAQTSQALNLCAATVEFSGSTESVEGERHLLVATHRRQACMDEVQRLRIEKTLRPTGTPRERGHLSIKEITIPLRQDYIRKLASDTISGHHLVCLIKYNEHVLATRTVPTLPGLLAVKFPDVLQLNNVYADFKVTLEIYGMTAQREVLPHEVKYHININKKGANRTPKKKTHDNRLIMPPVQSPAGPHVIRTPALVQYGYAIFSLREIQRTTWSLTQVLGVSPLDGVVHMKVNCELSVSVEHRGFLTMYEDISGFGAWHRRWCYLNGTILNYWKYPDDEKKKTPMGSIDLYNCITQKITTVPRDICARLNTMLLECERPALDTDHESLILLPNGRNTIVRYLLSADTKDEREEWCSYFNKALTLIRAWGPPQ